MNKLFEFVRSHKWETIYIAIAALALSVFLIGSSIGWTTEDRIEKAFCRHTGRNYTFFWTDKETKQQGANRFYGTYEGCDVFFFPSDLCVESSQKIGDFTFWNSSGFTLFVHKFGKIFTLQEAYSQGLISDSSLKLIYEEHQSWYEP